MVKWVWIAALAAGHWACSSGATLSMLGGDESAASPEARVPGPPSSSPGSPTAHVTPSPPMVKTAFILIGAQPVEGSAVEVLPAHADHVGLVQTPPRERPETALPAAVPLRHLYVSPTGSDGASGLAGHPVRTLMKAVSLAEPGDLIHVGAGTYAETVEIGAAAKAGRVDAVITLRGEGVPTLVPAAGGYSIIQVERPHWVIDGFKIDVKGQAKYAVAFAGDTSGAKLMNSELANGTFGAGVTTYGNARDVTLENNHIYNFSRGTSDSHGVVVQPTSRNITIRHNDIHDVSGDSVQCIGPEGYSALTPADGLLIEANHFYKTRENAIDIKTCHNVVIRANRLHNFTQATSIGGNVVVVHMSAKNVTIEDNDIYDGGKGIAIGGNRVGPVPTNIIVRRNRIYGMKKTTTLEGAGIRVENSSGAVIANNTITNLQGPALVAGHGTGGSTTNLHVLNNIVDALDATDVGALAPGLVAKNNLFVAGARFTQGDNVLDFTRWKALGRDATSFEAPLPLMSGPEELVAPGILVVNTGAPDVVVTHCGAAPDLGAFESDCL